MIPNPLVSIILRRRGQGGLRAALRSVAAQTYDRIEAVVVDTIGDPDAAWPAIDWRPGFETRWLSQQRPLGEAQAANLALAAIRGELFCILDDDGVLDPPHIERLVDAARHSLDALVVYGRSRVVAGGQMQLAGQPANRALFFHEHSLCLAAALIRREAIERGCRFDETLELGAEQDFLEQISECGDLVFLDATAPTSTVAARTAAIAPRLYWDNLRFAKWTGSKVAHGLRATLACERAGRTLARGDLAAARAAFAGVLTRYPGIPQALDGLARCDLADGRLESASTWIDAAIGFDPSNAAYRQTAETIRQRLRSRNDDRSGAADAAITRTAADATPTMAPPTVDAAAAPARSSPCPCGSGKRFKHCCGRLLQATAAGQPPDDGPAVRIAEARARLRAGAADEAASLLARLAPDDLHDAALALAAGRCSLQTHSLKAAYAFFARSLELDPELPGAAAACDDCCQLLFGQRAWQSAGRTIRSLLDEQNATAASVAAGEAIHIVCRLDTVGGTERRALNLYRLLAPHARVTLWTTVPPLATLADEAPVRTIDSASAPSGGTLVLVGTYFPCGEWLETAAFARVVICHNLADQFPTLIQRLLQLGANPARPLVQLAFPSRTFRDAMGLPGAVEYSAVDLEAFRRRGPPPRRARVVVGRHARAYWMKFHPNDPAFFRGLMARGYGVRILGGTPISAAFEGAVGEAPELLDVDAEPSREFLASLDIFVYRKHPRFYETGGTSVLEAMAMELPVVAFDETCGIAEVIREGENGFLVDSEAQANAVIDRLARDPELRLRVGRAARASIVALLQEQAPRVLEFYLGARPQSPSAPSWLRRWFSGFGKKRQDPDVRGLERQLPG